MYRVDGRSDSVSKEFFIRGNALFRNMDFEEKGDIYLFHFDAARTAEYLWGKDPKSPLDEWCLTMWDDVRVHWNLLDGFANVQYLPKGSICLVSMCSPETLPLDVFQTRRDITKILYTAEGPNIRHAAQWTKEFLRQTFDTVLTFWQPLLDDPDINTIFAPHNARFLSFPKHNDLLRKNDGPGTGTVSIVLENRLGSAPYSINAVQLKCLDFLRQQYVTGLRNVAVHGFGWKEVPNAVPRHLDREHTPIDHYQKTDFALIVENCDAQGYVSEKFGDALIAGAIPLYYGNPSTLVSLPEGAYIDIHQYKNGKDLQTHLDSLSPDDILRMKRRILDTREIWLAERGSAMILRAVKQSVCIPTQALP